MGLVLSIDWLTGSLIGSRLGLVPCDIRIVHGGRQTIHTYIHAE